MEHECEQMGIFRVFYIRGEGWAIDATEEYACPIFFCPYCGLKLEQLIVRIQIDRP